MLVKLLTVHVEFHILALQRFAHWVFDLASVSSLVLLFHRADQQCRSVLSEVISLTGNQFCIVPEPPKLNSGSSIDRTSPSYVGFVLYN